MTSDISIILVAGGHGTRMNNDMPKQFLKIDQTPVIIHTIKQFLEAFISCPVIIAAPEDYTTYTASLIQEHFPSHMQDIKVCTGGSTRFHSVKNALRHCRTEYVMIHDAVRPCISPNWLTGLAEATRLHKCAVPYIKMNDSIRVWQEGQYQGVDRNAYIRIQTPQCFHYPTLAKAFEQEYITKFTDDATVWESDNNPLYFHEGLERNIKITTPDDMVLAANFLTDK